MNDEIDNHSPHAIWSTLFADPAMNTSVRDYYEENLHMTRMLEKLDLAPPRRPTRATQIPSDAKMRKTYPIASGVLDYFPDAIAAIAHLSFVGNEQHNPGKPLDWDRTKSQDEADTLMRHFLQRGTVDSDGIRHSVKVAWRALALLQKELEAAA